MEIIEFRLETINDLFSKVRRDIYKFEENGIPRDKLSVSLPNYLKKMLEYTHKQEYNCNEPITRFLEGLEIVPGYNNQVCVFYKDSNPNTFTVEPIIVSF